MGLQGSDGPSNVDGIDLSGFSEPVTIEELQGGGGDPPPSPGVYVVLREDLTPPQFREANVGGWFQGQRPAVPVETLEREWVPEARILYIGKTSARRGLRSRIRAFMGFGLGQPVAHWGGRLIWQLGNYKALKVRWLVIIPPQTPERKESELLHCFEEFHNGRLPFANLRR